jgi:SAM-dependent methyltransferase
VIFGGEIGYRWLRWISPPQKHRIRDGEVSDARSKLEISFGPGFWTEIAGRVVIDFGCGDGRESVEMARRGAARVIGVDNRPHVLEAARIRAAEAGVPTICTFAERVEATADVIVSIDAFEHFEDPGAILTLMAGLLRPTGSLLVSFGPPWFHPKGGHTFSVLPWSHLLFSEKSLIRWRSDFKSDGATRFTEVEGGLNQMTIRRFEHLVGRSGLVVKSMEAVPIQRTRLLHNRLTREFLTAIVKCRLVLRA